jgi:nucleosome binding factor SPN SPT16 subunit
LKENTLSITETNEKVVQAGNVFLVDVTFTDITYDAKKGGKKNFGVQLIDTVIVEEKGPEMLTASVSKSLADISYSLEDDEEEDNKKKSKNIDLPEQSNIIEGSRRRRRNEVAQERLKSQKERNEHQKKLKLKKLE